MSVKSNLNLAKKYEWNAYICNNCGDEAGKVRYETMAKMAMLNAADLAASESNKSKHTSNTVSTNYTYNYADIKFLSPNFIIPAICTSVFLILIYVFGGSI